MIKISDQAIRKALKDLDVSTLDMLKPFIYSFHNLSGFLKDKDQAQEFVSKLESQEILDFLKCVTASGLIFIESQLSEEEKNSDDS